MRMLAIAAMMLILVGCSTEVQEVSVANVESALSLMKARAQNNNEQLGFNLFQYVEIKRSTGQLTITVEDTWYGVEDFMQDRTVDDWIGVWTVIAGNNGWTGLARLQFIDAAGKQVAYKSRSIPNR